jgi:hypothetical protein
MLDRGLISPGRYSLTGSIKLETAELLTKAEQPLFANGRPIVLYNPHFEANLNSWRRFLSPMLQAFEVQHDFNLIVAPHVKMFRHATRRRRARIEARSSESILIDTGSERSMDSTYASCASIYVGDVSSQVYEFLANPRPCVFLNAHGIDWRNNPNYLHWHLGDVVDHPSKLYGAIRAAPERHHLYRERQLELAAAALGDRSPGASERAAAAILDFLRRDLPKATRAIASAARSEDGFSVMSKV